MEDGVSEDLVAALLTLPAIDVVAWSSSTSLRGAGKRRASQTLGASHVLDGAVQRVGDRIRISVSLIDARAQTVLWGRAYDGGIDDLLTLENHIARDMTDVLKLAVADTNLQVDVDPVAYRLFLGARDQLNRVPPRAHEAVGMLTAAVERSPRFSRGWSMLSAAYVATQGPIDESAYTPVARANARDAAHRALALNPRNAQAYAALAATSDRPGAWARIETLLTSGLRYEPSNIDALYGAGAFYADVGWNHRSVSLLRRAQSLDPLTPQSTFLLLRVLEADGRDDEVEAMLSRASRRWPGNRSLWRFSLRRAIWKDRLSEARSIMGQAPPNSGEDAGYFADLIACREDADSPRLDTFLAPVRGDPLPFTWPIVVFALAMLGETAACVALVRRIYLSPTGRRQAPTWVLHQGMMGPVRADPGVQDTFRQLGLTAFWAAEGRQRDDD